MRNEKLMDDTPEPTESPSAAGLHEYVDAEFTIADFATPAQEKTLHDAIKGLPGLEKVSIGHGKVSVEYEPVLLSRQKLEEVIQRAGFRIAETEAAPASSLTDAFSDRTKDEA